MPPVRPPSPGAPTSPVDQGGSNVIDLAAHRARRAGDARANLGAAAEAPAPGPVPAADAANAADVAAPLPPAFAAYQAEQRVLRAAEPAGLLPTARRVARVVARELPASLLGAAVGAITSVAAALTLTRPLLQLVPTLAQAGADAPFYPTRLLASVAAALSAPTGFALLGGCVVAAGLMATAIYRSEPSSARAGQLLAQGGMGLLLSPFWSVAQAGRMGPAYPALGLAVACCVGLQLVLQRLRHDDRLGPVGTLMTSALLTAAATTGASLACGTSAALAFGSAVGWLIGGAVAAAGFLWASHLGNTDDRETALLRSFAVRGLDRRKRLALPDEPRPTVYARDPGLLQSAAAMKANLAAGHPVGGLYLLHGPAGTGKTETAQALANLGDWPMYSPPLSVFFDAPAPEAVVVQLFDEARRAARRSGTTQVLFFDEADMLFCDRGKWQEAGSQDAVKPLALTEAFNHELGGVLREQNANLIVIVSTNHPDRLDPAALARFTRHDDNGATVQFTAPTAHDLGQMLGNKFTALHQGYAGLRSLTPYGLDDVRRQRLQARLVAGQATGRDVNALVAGVLRAANAASAAQPEGLTQAQFTALVHARLDAAASGWKK